MIIRLNRCLFTMGYVCLVLAFLITITTLPNNYEWINVFTRWLRIFGYAFLCIKILLHHKSSTKSILLIIFAVISLFITALITDNQIILTDMLLIMAATGVDFENIVKIDLFMRMMFVLFVWVLFYMGTIPEAVDYRNLALKRHSYGFAHPNRLALHLCLISIEIFYLKHGRFKKITYLFLILLLFLTEVITNGRTSEIGILFLIIAELFYKKFFRKYIEKYCRITLNVVFCMTIFLSIIIPVIYVLGFNIHIRSSSTIYARIELAANGLMNNGLTLLGQKIQTIATLEARRLGVLANAIDNLYVNLLVNYGIITFIIMIVFIVRIIKHITYSKDDAAFYCIIIIMVMSLMEAQFLSAEANVFLLLANYKIIEKSIH